MKKSITEKKILSMISTAVDNLEVDVWDKIVNSKASNLEEINFSPAELPKQTRMFVPGRIASIVAAFIFMIIGIYAFLRISGIISGINLNPNMHASPFLAVAEYDNKLFFQNFKDESKLYCMDLDENKIKKISDDSVANFTIDNGDIYYIDMADGKIVMLKTDGTNRKVLEKTNATWNIAVFEDWIYYSSNDGIFRIKNDGSNMEKISNVYAHTLHVYNGNVYFSSSNENDEGLYKAELDGKNTVKIYDRTVYYFDIYKNNIYFYNTDDNCFLYKITTDGNNIEKVRSNGRDIWISTGEFDIFNGEIYFTHERLLENQNYLYKMSLDNGDLVKLVQIEATTIKVFGQHIYLYHPSYNGRLYRLNVSENTLEKIIF